MLRLPGVLAQPTTWPESFIAAAVSNVVPAPRLPRSTGVPSRSHKTACGPICKGRSGVVEQMPEEPATWPALLIVRRTSPCHRGVDEVHALCLLHPI
jgi:hypothetical protein